MYDYLTATDDGLKMREAGLWVTDKLDYLSRYINAFETAMRKKWVNRNYIDLLAGPGKNRVREDGAILFGSPLLALTTKHPFTGYYFVDLDPSNTYTLEKRCSASPLRERIHIYTGDCNQVVDTIVAELKRNQPFSLNLAFLDPQGLELRWETVAKLASLPRMDLIINYPQYGLSRAMKPAFAHPGDTAVDEFFGGRDWRIIYKVYSLNRRSGLHRQLIDLYKAKLQSLGYVEVHHDEEAGDEPLIRNTARNAPLYRLLFASKDPLGKIIWNSITRRDVHGQRRLFDSR